MKGKKYIFAIALVHFFLFSCQSSRDSSFDQRDLIRVNQVNTYDSREMQYVSNQVLVKFKSSITEEMREAAIASYQSTTLKRISEIDVYHLQIPEDISVEEMLYLLERNPDVEYAEPNYVRRLAQVTPNDPFFTDQYALYNPGGQFGPPSSPQPATARADIKATEGWVETWGDETVIIAILDTGADFNHPDLDGKLLSNGYDFINDDPDPIDDEGHGTLVAGIAAAETNNGVGIAGVAWDCRILPIKIVDNTGWTDDATIIAGINWAILNGADVINLSVGGAFASQFEQDAIRAAYINDIVVVAAAGNDGVATNYPAAYPECMAVAATNSRDERVTFVNTATDPVPWESNFGPEIDVAAPGDWVLSLYPTSLTTPPFLPYSWASGTSLSTPHVSGLAALIKSIKPDLSAEDIMNIIRYTADDVNSATLEGRDDNLGYGRMNMERALVPIILSSLNSHK